MKTSILVYQSIDIHFMKTSLNTFVFSHCLSSRQFNSPGTQVFLILFLVFNRTLHWSPWNAM